MVGWGTFDSIIQREVRLRDIDMANGQKFS